MHFITFHKVIISGQWLWAVVVGLDVLLQVPWLILIKDKEKKCNLSIHIQSLSTVVQCPFPADHQGSN